MNELKPCPFCGGKAILTMQWGIGKDWHVIYCEECGAKIMRQSVEQVVIMAWNRRDEK